MHPVRDPWSLVIALFLCAGVLAGCLAPPGDEGDEEDGHGNGADRAVDLDAFRSPLMEGHDHTDPSLHGMWWNFNRTGGSLLENGNRGYAGPHALDVKADKLFVSAYSALGEITAGLYIFDLAADPADPPLLGSLGLPGNGAGDRNMEATEDGEYVVMSFEGRDCAGHLQAGGAGTYLINTQDPRDPQVVHYLPVPDASLGQHSVTVYSSPEGDYVYHGGGDGYFYTIDRGLEKLVPVGEWMAGHDSALFWDPLGQRMLLLAADVSHMTIYDVSDPESPQELGGWALSDEDAAKYYVHTVVADHIAGRNIAVVNSEDFRDHPTRFWVMDITEPDAPELLSQWTAPDNVTSGPLTLSLHNPRMQNGILTFSFYHAGVWQFNMSEPANWLEPRPRAFYLPSGPVGRMPTPDAGPVLSVYCGARLMTEDLRLDVPMDAVPFTFDVELYRDHVYAADVNTGMHVLRFDPSVGASWDNDDDPHAGH